MTRVNRIAENGIWKPGAITYHGVEQYRYVYDKVNSRRITHVLYYENLEDDFNSLMDLYGLPIKYSSKIVNPSPFQRNASAHDLEDETVNRINKIYAKDFKMFGYQPKRELQSWSNYTYDSSFPQKKKKKVMLATTKLKTLSVNSKHSNENPFLCAISRAHNEHEKLDSFIHHNLQEGFDKIVIIDDRYRIDFVMSIYKLFCKWLAHAMLILDECLYNSLLISVNGSYINASYNVDRTHRLSLTEKK